MRPIILLIPFYCLAAAKPNPSNVEQVSKRLDSLISQIEAQRFVDHVEKSLDKVAFLKPSDAGFSTIQTSLGPITFSLKDVTPYTNGSKVVLTIGNVTSATFNNLKMKIDWGKMDKDGHIDSQSEKTKEFTVPNPIKGGYWNSVEVVLEETPPVALGYVRISEVECGGINLNTW